MEERNKMSEIHRIVMNYNHFTTSTTFANEEDERSYTQDLLNEIGKIVNLLPIHDVSGMFSEEKLKEAYEDGWNDYCVDGFQEFNADNYR